MPTLLDGLTVGLGDLGRFFLPLWLYDPVSGHGGGELMVGLDVPGGLFWPWWFYDSI